MELEALIGGNQILLYFIGIFYILINETFEKKQKIIIIYICSYCLKLFNIMDFKIIIIILSIVSILYIGFLSKDNIKNIILNNIWYKFKDWVYKIIFEYSGIYFLVSMILITNTIKAKIQLISFFDIGIPIINININIISVILLIWTLNNITSQKYESNQFTVIKKGMDNVTQWTEIEINQGDIEKMEMLIDIEDKSFFIRENSYNFLSIEFLKYQLDKIKIIGDTIKCSIQEKGCLKCIRKVISKRYIAKKIVKKFELAIRGYSTIEMQMIRTLGIKYGYSYKIYRKIYELIYSKMFFKSLRKNMNKCYLDTKGHGKFKEYLLTVYIGIAPIYINGKHYKSMLEIWKKQKISEVSKEQFFISILGLSWRTINPSIIHNYSNIINKYDIDKNNLLILIDDINSYK